MELLDEKREQIEDIKHYKREFDRYTSSEDMTGMMLKAHLFIENELEKLINNALINPMKFPSATFANKVDLAYALGLIEKEWIGAFRKLNYTRNKYAHDIDYNFTDKDFEDLLSTLSKDSKSQFKKDVEFQEFFMKKSNKLNENQKVSLTLIDLTRILLSNFWFYLKLNNLQIYTILKIQFLDRKIKNKDFDK